MELQTQSTTLGEITYNPIKGTVLTVIAGMWYNGDLPIVFYTSEDRTSGVIATYNAKTNKLVKMERIKFSEISAESRKMYGKKYPLQGKYPIYKTA